MLPFKALFALSIFAASAAQSADIKPRYFENEGQRYEYTTRLEKDVILIEGNIVRSGEKFSLYVAATGRVTGRFGGQPVSYSVSRAIRNRLAARLTPGTPVAVAEASNP